MTAEILSSTPMTTTTALEVAALAMYERGWSLRRVFNQKALEHARAEVAEAVQAGQEHECELSVLRPATAAVVGRALTAQTLYAQPEAQGDALRAGEVLFPIRSSAE
jgi:hypothetical protein